MRGKRPPDMYDLLQKLEQKLWLTSLLWSVTGFWSLAKTLPVHPITVILLGKTVKLQVAVCEDAAGIARISNTSGRP